MSTTESPVLEQFIDSARYPVSEPDSQAWQDLVARTQAELNTVGCCVLPDFIVPAVHEDLRDECAEIAPQAYYTVETVNTYNIATDVDLPPDHPGRITMERGNAFVARDRIAREAIIHRLYTSEVFQHFVASHLPSRYDQISSAMPDSVGRSGREADQLGRSVCVLVAPTTTTHTDRRRYP